MIGALVAAFSLSFCGVVLGAEVNNGKTQSTRSILSMDVFLQQVRKDNQEFTSAAAGKDGALLREGEGSLLTRPALVGSSSYLDSKKESGSVLLGNETISQSYSVGLRQQTDFGLDAKLLYNFSDTSLPGANPALVPETAYFQSGPLVEFTQSLWRNGFGSETRASKALLNAQAMATAFNESFHAQQIMAAAEQAYWRLALAREAVAATEETVINAERLHEWSSKRKKLNLGNNTDFLQAEAALLNRRLEHQTAVDEERAAARAFNTMRGLDSNSVSEGLSAFEPKLLEGLAFPEKSPARNDVKAAEQSMIVAQATSQLAEERNTPTLNLVGAVGLNGRDATAGEAVSESFGTSRRDYAVGLKLDIPLSIGTQKDVRAGYRLQADAAALAYERKKFEYERLWQDLTIQFRDTITRYRLAERIQEVSREKVQGERIRHRRGLSTTFQAVQFEQEFANAQLARIRVLQSALNLFSQIKTFGVDQ